jgi:hypothetical protein
MSVTSFAKKAAPWITTIASAAVPGAAPFIGIASKLLSTGLNTTVKPDAQSITNAITEAMANPEQLAVLKKIDDDFAVQMKALDIQDCEALAKIAADDVANARQREMTVKDKIPALLAVLITLGFFGVLSYMLLRTIPPAGHDAMLLMLGSLSTAWTSVVAYYFGSSAGSDRKTELLAAAPPIPK